FALSPPPPPAATNGRVVAPPGRRGPASVFVYTLAPEKLLGWNRPLTPEERAYIPSRYANLPTLGRLTGRGNTANVEVMLASHPDVIIDYGVVNPTYVSLADRVQQP